MNSNQLASLALFQTMYNSGSNIYHIVGKFVIDCLYRKRGERLNISELQDELKLTFGFDFPFAVLQTVLKKNKDRIVKESGEYFLNDNGDYDNSIADEKQNKEIFIYNNILSNLAEFIKIKEPDLDINNELLLRGLCSFLLKNDEETKYHEYIAGFIRKNKNEEVKDFLQEISDGGVIIAGLEYQNDTNEIYNLRKDLTLYLDMEWLFSAYGYNGEIYKKIFLSDFIPLVRELNAKSKGKIKLRILPNTMDDIDKFFSTAEKVLEDKLMRENDAMSMILANCKCKSDVVENKHKFINFLRGLDISVDDNAILLDLNVESEYKYNLDNAPSRSKFSRIDDKELDEYFSILNIINKLRITNKIYASSGFEESSFVFITATKNLINLSRCEKIENEFSTPLVLDLSFVINRLWFKLQKSFKNNDRPLSLDILVNANLVLRSIFSDNLANIYNELKNKYVEGKITKELATQLIANYREQAKSKLEDEYVDVDYFLILEDDIDKAKEEISIRNSKLNELSEDNNKKSIKIESLEKDNQLLYDENQRMLSELNQYKKKEVLIGNIGCFIFRFIKVGVIMFFLFIFLRILFSKYQTEIGFLSAIITILMAIYPKDK